MDATTKNKWSVIINIALLCATQVLNMLGFTINS